MARISKRHKDQVDLQNVAKSSHRVFRAGIYARISVDTDEKKNLTVETQIIICEEFIKRQNEDAADHIEIVEYYKDYGESGYGFGRDEFQRMIQDVRIGTIDCIVVKDLSRFARNHAECGNYLERIFPFLGIRFIAVNDEIDTFSKDFDKRKFALTVKNIINEMYCVNSSVKAKSQINQRRERGSYIGGAAPYGYSSVYENGVRKLVVNEETAPVVQEIFELFLELKNYTGLSTELHARKINPPQIYYRTQKVYCDEGQPCQYWGCATLKQLLVNEVYLGYLAQNKTQHFLKDHKRTIHYAPEEWIRQYDTHVALISSQTHEDACKICNEISEKYQYGRNPVEWGENIFENVLYCGVCGRPLQRERIVKDKQGESVPIERYVCRNGVSRDKFDECPTRISINKVKLAEIVREELQILLGLYAKRPAHYLKRLDVVCEERRGHLQNKVFSLEREFRQIEKSEADAFEKYYLGELTEGQYREIKESSRIKKQALLEQIQNVRDVLHSSDVREKKCANALRRFLKMRDTNQVTKEAVESLVTKIEVLPDKKIIIEWSFNEDELKEGFE